MRNFVRLNSAEEAFEYVYSLWETKQFRDSQTNTEGFIRHIVTKLTDRPIIFHEMSDPEMEWSHFTTWMGSIALREYDNPAIQDLYYLHEMAHAATMEYDPLMPFAKWHTKMCVNEMFASTVSEVYVYCKLPGLRELSFDFEIWADRILKDEAFGDYDPVDAGPFLLEDREFNTYFSGRVRAMRDPDPFDFIEMQIAKYGRQNFEWSTIWKDNYKRVEEAVHKLYAHEDRGWSRKDAIERHISWLNAEIGSERGSAHREIPFWWEANVFTSMTKKLTADYGNEILET